MWPFTRRRAPAPEAMAPDAIEIHPGTPNVYYEPVEEKGADTKPFFDDPNNVVVEGSYYTQRQPHLPIEPDVGFGYINEKGQVVIHSKSVGIHLHALMIALGLGLKFPEELVVVQNPTGGTFGYVLYDMLLFSREAGLYFLILPQVFYIYLKIGRAHV